MRAAVVAAILLLALRAADAAPDPLTTLPEPIVWRQNVFSIPYRVRRPAGTEAVVAEVQLFVSDDAGHTWRLAPRTAPTGSASNITFTAAHDGEFWFSLRTIDRQGRVAPTGPHRPGLRVIVDTQQPKLTLQATASRAGAVDVRWYAEDVNLRLDSLKIETRSGPNSPWQSLAIGRPPVELRGARSGNATWWPQGETGRVTVRAEVFDHAGNPTVAQTEVTLRRRTTPPIAATPAAMRNQPISARPATTQSWPTDQISLTPLGTAPTSRPTDPAWRPGTDVVGPRPR